MITRLTRNLLLRAIRFSLLIIFSVLGCCSADAQVSVTATAGTLGPTTYTTLSLAFSAINAGTHKGVINISISGTVTETAVTSLLNGVTAPASYTSINIKPSGDASIVMATPVANRAIIELQGADNVTIDGDDPATSGTRNLTIAYTTTAATAAAVIRVSSNSATGTDGASNNTIKNCIITGNRVAGGTTATYGINMSNYSTTSLGGGGASSINNTFDNNLITRVYHGVWAVGVATYLNTGLKIRNNILGDGTQAGNIGNRGVLITYSASAADATSAIISGNDIQGGDPTGAGYNASVAGIEIGTQNTGIQVYNNNIHDIRQPATSGYHAIGIFVTGSAGNTSANIYNNIIRDMVASFFTSTITTTGSSYGIYFSAGATNYAIDHNTIVLKTSPTTGTLTGATITACVALTVSGVTLSSFRNNILVNTISTPNSYGIYCAATTNISASNLFNNNNYYTSPGAVGYYNAAMQSTLAAWKLATGKDANSQNINPTFISATDMHISPLPSTALESGGTAIATITSDIDGQVRPGPAGSVNGGGTSPDIGADEFDGFVSGCSSMPGTITASNVASTSATINWIAAAIAPAAGYDYYFSTSSTAPTTTISGSVAAGVTAANLSALTPNTTYYVWVRSKCDATTTSGWVGPINFTTTCTPYNLSVIQGFNALTIPSCWSQQYVTGTSNISYPTSSANPTTTPQEGTNFVYWGSNAISSGNETRLVSPPIITTGVPSVDVQFQWFHDNTAFTGSGYADEGVFVEYSTNGTTWTQVGSQITRLGGVNGWTLKTVTLPAGAGNQPVIYVGFRFRSKLGDNCSMDAVDIHATPACSAQPTSLTSAGITTTSATISWTAASPAPVGGYEYYYSTSSVAPVNTPSGSVAAGTTSVSLSALSIGTTYYFWVRSVCVGTERSVWVGPLSFTTLNPCVISTLPWTENFDAMTAIGTSIIPNCWRAESTSGTPWASMNAAGNTYNDPLSAPNYMTVYYSPYSATEKYLITPGFSLTAGVSYDFSFQFAGDGYTGWNADAGFNTTQTGTGYTIMGSAFLSSATTSITGYTSVTRSFVPVTSGVYYFMVHVNSNITPYYLGFDNFSVSLTPPCAQQPSALTSSAITTITATISWTAASPAPASGYQYYVSTNATAPTAVTAPTGSTAAGVVTANLTGLNPAATYYVWVRSNCNATDRSGWNGPINFTTLCAALNVPWSENFDAMPAIGTSIVPPCWKVETPSGTPWASMNAASTTFNDPASAPNYVTCYYVPSGGTNLKYLITPGFNLTANTTYIFGFDFAGDGYAGWTGQVGYGSSQVGTGFTVLGANFITNTTTSSATYTNVTRTFTPTTTGVYYFMVKVNNNGTPFYLGFDNFNLTAQVSCSGTPAGGTASASPASGLVSSAFTLNANGISNLTGVTFQWQSSPDGITWTNIAGATTNPYTATAVSSITTTYYRLAVRCTSSGLTGYSTSTTYITNYCVPVITTACTSNDYVNSFSLNTLSNLNSGCNGNANNYIQYAPTGTNTTTLTQGVTYNATVNIGRGGSGNVAIWIDYNNNSIFETTERYVNAALVPLGGTVTIPVSVPAGAALGTHRLRVMEVYSTTLAVLDPCTSYTYGETEDYTISIIASAPCSGTPVPGSTVANLTNVCNGSAVNLSLQNQITGSGVTYQWQSSADNITYTNITGATASGYSPTVNVSTWFRCVVTCSGNTGTSAAIQITSGPCVIMPSSGNTTATTCAANFYDSGGFLGNYNNNESGTITIYPSTPGSFVRITFTSFEVETCCDNLKIYNGNAITAPLIGTYTALPGVITSTAADGSLTLSFTSDGSVVATGWEAVISCYVPPPCAGLPAPGATLSNSTFVCTNTATVLSIANPPAGSGVTYQWQSAPDVAGIPGTFANITGALSPTYTYTPVAAATLWYRCVVTCSGNSANSSPIQIVAAVCNVINMSSGSINTCAAQFYDNGGSAANYSDNQSLTYTIYPSTPGAKIRVAFNSFNVETCCDNLKIYDGNSIASLLLGVFTSNPGTITSTAADGSLTFVFTSDGSVNRTGWDATISCYIPPPCTSILVGGSAATSPSTGQSGSSFTLNATGYSAVSGLTFQWQSSTDGVTWTNIAGATTIPYSMTAPGAPGVITVTYYQLLITCPNTNTTVISAPTTFTTASYCLPTHTTTTSTYMTKISFLGTLNDVTNYSTYSSTGYQDFTPLSNRARQAQGEGVNLYIQSNSTAYMNGWADWNSDGAFDASEKIFTSGSILAFSSTFGFVIPITTPPGNYRIRIRTTTSGSAYDACATLSNGETEDYLLTVIPTCNIFINSVVNGTICGTGQVDLSVTATAGATQYFWYTLPTGGILAATTSTPNWTTPTIRSTTNYYVTAGNGSCESNTRTVIKAIVNAVPVLSFSPNNPIVCGEGAVLRLNASGDFEEGILLNENFENGLGLFTVNNILSGTNVNLTQWQMMTSTYIPLNTAVWHPAISSGVGANHFVYSTSDFSGTSVNTALVSPAVNTTNYTSLYMDMSVYYSHYLTDGDVSGTDSVLIEASINNGTTWSRVDYYISDQGIGTRFNDNTIDLSAFVNQPSLRVRIRYRAYWSDGLAVDDIRIYGYKPLSTTFSWSPVNQNNLFTDSTGLTPYTGGSVPNIYIRPTLQQLDTSTNLVFTATATLSNGCSASSPITVSIVPSQWTGDVSTDWHNINNWCSKVVPLPTTKVEIPAGLTRYPIISAPATAKSILVNSGSSLTVTNTGKLSVYGSMTNLGGNLDAKNGTVEIASPSSQTFAANLFTGNNLKNLIINTDTLKLGGTLNLLNKLSFTGSNRNFVTNGNLVLKSSDTLTAYVSDITNGLTATNNKITGQVSVERFASAKRAWRLLSSPTRHDLQTIKQAWQEGAGAPNANPVIRYGIQITSNRTTWLNDGFDTFSIAGPSVKVYNPLTNLYDGITTTNAAFTPFTAYMSFVRGDRSVTQLTQAPTTTTLREKGTLYTGNVVVPVGTRDSQFVSVGNPYAAAVDFTKVDRVNVGNTFYLWDPALSTYGGYQTCLVSGNSILYTPGGGSYSSNNFSIQSGQGFFVRTQGGAGSITFKETSKVDGSLLVSRVVNTVSQLRTRLYRMNSNNPELCDGVLNIFDSNASDGVDQDDAMKFSNTNENLSIMESGKSLSIESRSGLQYDDTVYLKISQMRLSDYRFVVYPQQLSQLWYDAYLEDNYLQTRTPLNLNDSTVISFSIINVPAAYAPDRFRIVFKTNQTLPVKFTSIRAKRNNDKSIGVTWDTENETDVHHYELERSGNGRDFASIHEKAALNNNSAMHYSYNDIAPLLSENYYRVKAFCADLQQYYSTTVKVSASAVASDIKVEPNPVVNRNIQLQCTNLPSGKYAFELRNLAGQLITEGNLIVVSSIQKLTVPLKIRISSGVYNLTVKVSEQDQRVLQIIVN